ncbi:class I SAM-dependent methyltransferase [Planktothrix sp.]|uniref:class I SAM-dependent methyltransferase n=1 Tax=Planktothrix sp. TaxID=3088171 RepID=UPI0038D44C6C
MQNQDPELLQKIRQQFDSAPYPRIPLEQSPKNDYELLFIHNLVTPYYLKYQKVINTEGKIILDAGCGSGYKSLVLAEANPGVKIVGIDISEQSIELAKQRLKFHGFDNAEFHVLSIEDLPQLGYEFDYINADEVLYLCPNLFNAMQGIKQVLKPQGIIRANVHSLYQRIGYFRAQSLFKLMGVMDESSQELKAEIARETIESIKDEVVLKTQTWNSPDYKNDEWLLANYLLQGDKGYTIPELFAVLKATDLQLISMVKWRQWQLLDLFKEPDNLPTFLAFSLSEISIEEQLHLFELINPVHRLLDFWCGHCDQEWILPVSEWTEADWQTARVHLHPQLRTNQAKADLIECIQTYRPYEISQYVKLPTRIPITLESRRAACLLPLWDGEQTVISLAERWQQIYPVDPITLEPMTVQRTLQQIQELLITLDAFLYVLLEHSGLN